MITETSAVAFRQNLGEMINQVQYRRDSIVINKDALASRFADAYADVPAEAGVAEIEKAVAKVRGKGVKRTTAASRTKKG